MTVRRAVTMADVGAAAGVSDATVSNVLSGKVAVSPATRSAVMAAVQRLGYQLNVSARGLRTGRTGFITLAIPDLGIDYFTELARAVMREAAPLGWAVTIQQTGSDRQQELDILSGANRQFSDGLIFQPHALDQNDRDALVTEHPIVLLGDRIFNGPVDHVAMANTAAARAATQHLLQLGRRRIAVIGPNSADTSVSAASLRLHGHRQALTEAGVPFDERLIGEAPRWERADGERAVAGLLASGADFDGLFCFNDTLAFGALHALREAQLCVPRDVSVVGFDNVPASAYAYPPLTTIDPGGAEIARTAVLLLADRINKTPSGPAQEVVPDFKLIRRVSA